MGNKAECTISMFLDNTTLGRRDQYAGGQGGHSHGPQQTAGVSTLEHAEVQQRQMCRWKSSILENGLQVLVDSKLNVSIMLQW